MNINEKNFKYIFSFCFCLNIQIKLFSESIFYGCVVELCSALDKRIETAIDKSSHQLQSCRSLIYVSESLGSHVNMLREWLMASKIKSDAWSQLSGLSLQQVKDLLTEHNVSICYFIDNNLTSFCNCVVISNTILLLCGHW